MNNIENSCGQCPKDEITVRRVHERYLLYLKLWGNFVNSSPKLSELYTKKIIDIDMFLLRLIAERYFKDVSRIKCFHSEIKNLSEYKIAGYSTYWLNKLKPIKININLTEMGGDDLYINESFALFVGMSRLTLAFESELNDLLGLRGYEDNIIKKNIAISASADILEANLLHNLLYTLKYRITTGDNLSLIYESLVSGCISGFKWGLANEAKKVL